MNSSSLKFVVMANGDAVPLATIPDLPFEVFQESILAAVAQGCRVSALFAVGRGAGTVFYVVLADDQENHLYVGCSEIRDDSFPALTPRCPQVQLFEREIAEQFGLRPLDHPWCKPVRYCRSWSGRDAWGRDPAAGIEPGVGEFYQVAGEQVHEVAVGPVHAGVIEPGHFRFQCHGEEVMHLEIALGYQHRGVEKALLGGPDSRSLHLAETLAGDTTIAHTMVYCQLLEALGRVQKPVRAQALRGIALELERLANHVGDLGALSGDVGFLPTASYCGRIRGEFLNLTAYLCGNRFGRGLVLPGGVGFDVDGAGVEEMRRRVAILEAESTNAITLLWENQSVVARFEDTGRLSPELARELGIVGPAARAAGLQRDVRCDHPLGIFRFAQIPISTYDSGDVFGRAYVRWLEVQQSIAFIVEQLRSLPPGPVRVPTGRLQPASLAVALSEGWRGEVCHVAITDEGGRFARYKVVDPSFHNWFALAQVLRNQEISDFPLCNKSFNLSYCGHDL